MGQLRFIQRSIDPLHSPLAQLSFLLSTYPSTYLEGNMVEYRYKPGANFHLWF
jgi:hypothetical protein